MTPPKQNVVTGANKNTGRTASHDSHHWIGSDESHTTNPDFSRGFVYVVEAKGDRVKIGWTQNPRQRLRNLSFIYGDLYVWTIEQGSRTDEMRLHQQWRDERIEGEWFHATDELREVVEGGRLLEGRDQ